ncbi:hypothetical protein COOONC_16516 [Cooperia oncophora]
MDSRCKFAYERIKPVYGSYFPSLAGWDESEMINEPQNRTEDIYQVYRAGPPLPPPPFPPFRRPFGWYGNYGYGRWYGRWGWG